MPKHTNTPDNNEQGSIVDLNLKEYKDLLNQLKSKIRGARMKSALAVN